MTSAPASSSLAPKEMGTSVTPDFTTFKFATGGSDDDEGRGGESISWVKARMSGGMMGEGIQLLKANRGTLAGSRVEWDRGRGICHVNGGFEQDSHRGK